MTILKDKVVFITGASSGIGKASAFAFAKAGAKLLLCARRYDKLEEVKHEINQLHGTDVYIFTLDVSHKDAVLAAFHDLKPLSNIDILINNAGLALGLASIVDGDMNDWETMISTNINGLLYVTKCVLAQMVKRKSGHVINLGSVAGHHVYPNGAIYCATKHAVAALTQAMRLDLLGTNIRVSSIDPGMVESDFSLVRFKGDKKRATAVYEGIQALTPNDIADAILYIASCPPHVNISEMIIMPTAQASATQVARK